MIYFAEINNVRINYLNLTSQPFRLMDLKNNKFIDRFKLELKGVKIQIVTLLNKINYIKELQETGQYTNLTNIDLELKSINLQLINLRKQEYILNNSIYKCGKCNQESIAYNELECKILKSMHPEITFIPYKNEYQSILN